MLKRKDSIVDNIRKRIQQIEHSESTKMGPRMRAKRYQGYWFVFVIFMSICQNIKQSEEVQVYEGDTASTFSGGE